MNDDEAQSRKSPRRAADNARRNMRELGVQRLIASCLNDACGHTALIDVSSSGPCCHKISTASLGAMGEITTSSYYKLAQP